MSRVAPLLLLAGYLRASSGTRYDANWSSLDSRPLPQWYDDAKIGIFIVGGVFSVPSWGAESGGASGEWFQDEWQIEKQRPYVEFMAARYPPAFTYADFAGQLTYDLFNATQWADLFLRSGAKYTVFLTKHHDGFTLWPAANKFNWNSVDVGPHRDITGEISAAVKATGLHSGLYHSLFEWLNPLYLADKAANFTTRSFVTQTMSELKDIVERYEPEVIWSDGDWEAPDSYWDAPENFLAWLVNESPVKDTVVFNDRWGKGDTCNHGSYYTCQDRYNPGKLIPHKWENAMTLDRHSWGFRRNADLSSYLSFAELMQQVVSTIAYGGNILINVGPALDGTIPVIMEERLLSLGSWLAVNGEGVYNSRVWLRAQNETGVAGSYYVQNPLTGALYLHLLNWPAGGNLRLHQPTPSAAGASAFLLAGGAPGVGLPCTVSGVTPGSPGLTLQLPAYAPNLCGTGSDVAWVVRLEGIVI
jgi:alpha-L-fucosidase